MIGSTIVNLDTIDSSNNYAAKELLTKSLKEGTVFVAACQQSGRGQGSSFWESEKGLNLTFSIILFPHQLEVVRQFSLSKAIALGLADFLSDEVSNVAIKWPNDIYVGDKKIAGILIETAISAGKFSRAIIGIGVNINQEKFTSDAPNPVSLKNITGKNYDLTEMLNRVCEKIDHRYSQLLERNSVIQTDYENLLYRKNVLAKYSSDGGELEGRIIGVGTDGSLLIETIAGEVRSFQFKEVGFILK